MPIFQDPDRQQLYDLWSYDRGNRNEQQILESSWVSTHKESWKLQDSSLSAQPSVAMRIQTFDRPLRHSGDQRELIQYLKEIDTSTLTLARFPDRLATGRIGALCRGEDVKATGVKSGQSTRNTACIRFDATTVDPKSSTDIERRKPALHSGDFRESGPLLQDQKRLQRLSHIYNTGSLSPPLGRSSNTASWSTSPLSTSSHCQGTPSHHVEKMITSNTRTRTLSLGSFSPTYVLKAPTTPLVHQASNADLDLPPESNTINTTSSMKLEQMSPHKAQEHVRRDSFPYETHRSHKSLTSGYSLQLASTVTTPAPSVRKPSFASEKSHAPMVGSYEESIIRGRMSMSPSKPFDFTAQIGVLGRGACKSSLKCPPHVTIPFPAVFYSYPTSGADRSIADDSPSPYVGLIDLENSLSTDDSSRGRCRRRHRSPVKHDNGQALNSKRLDVSKDADVRRLFEKKSRRLDSQKPAVGGRYRIPQQGQLQIMIKNPNKTAVKLFLVPYDLSDMEPGTKTFIRQRSYSADPVIDMPLSAQKNYGPGHPGTTLNTPESDHAKPKLRYLIHLNICCPSKGHFYLYSGIRVVFANRVPDGQEKLRNDIQQPDPRYTPYKPHRETTTGSKAATKKCLGRQSLYQSCGPEQPMPQHSIELPSLRLNPAGARIAPSPAPIVETQCMAEKAPHPFQPIPALKESPLLWRPEFTTSSSCAAVDVCPPETRLYYNLCSRRPHSQLV